MGFLCGVDEAGRGPLAGPVTAAAVILPNDFPLHILKDSKKMTAKSRERARDAIILQATWAVGWASHREIDKLNILGATLLAMQRAIAQIEAPIEQVFVDGNQVPDVPLPTEAVVRGDSTIPEIMAASILAKTSRDRWMSEYAQRDPRYGFERHLGYPTVLHRRLVLLHGPCPIHRRSFRVSDPGNALSPGTR